MSNVKKKPQADGKAKPQADTKAESQADTKAGPSTGEKGRAPEKIGRCFEIVPRKEKKPKAADEKKPEDAKAAAGEKTDEKKNEDAVATEEKKSDATGDAEKKKTDGAADEKKSEGEVKAAVTKNTKAADSTAGEEEETVNHFYIELLDHRTKIALEKVDETGEPTGEIVEENLSVEEFNKRFKTCSHHDCPLQPRTIDEIRKKMSDNRVELAEAHLKNGELEKAEDKFKRALKFDDESIKAQLGIGKVRMEEDKIDEAMKIFKEIGEANAIYEMSNKHTFNNFGIYLRKKGLLDLAIENYEKAITIDETDEVLYFNLSRAYVMKGEIQTGIQKMKEALTVDPEFKEAKQHLKMFMKQEEDRLKDLLTGKPDKK